MNNLQISVIESDNIDKNTIYLIPFATREEIIRGEYIEIGDVKLSKNKKKYGLLTNIGEEK